MDPNLGKCTAQAIDISQVPGPIWICRGRPKIRGACFWSWIGFIIGLKSRTLQDAIKLLPSSLSVAVIGFLGVGNPWPELLG